MTRAQLETLIETVEARSTNMHSYFHGPQHWRCVSRVGIELARETPGADKLVALLFGLFHDAMRENDDHDPEHGMRGAALLRQLSTDGLVPITESQRGYIHYACATHTEAPPTTSPPVGVCYDADRLNLWRVFVTPKEKYISTVAGRWMVLTQATEHMHTQPLEWSDVLDYFFRR